MGVRFNENYEWDSGYLFATAMWSIKERESLRDRGISGPLDLEAAKKIESLAQTTIRLIEYYHCSMRNGIACGTKGQHFVDRTWENLQMFFEEHPDFKKGMNKFIEVYPEYRHEFSVSEIKFRCRDEDMPDWHWRRVWIEAEERKNNSCCSIQ